VTRWQPSQFSRVVSLLSNLTQVDRSGVLTTRTVNLSMVQFRPGTIANTNLAEPTKWCGIGIFQSFCHGRCNGSLPFPFSATPVLPPSISLSHHWLDRWSSNTGCALYLLLCSSWLPGISSPITHHCFSHSCQLIHYIHRPSIYFRRGYASTVNTSNYSDSYSGVLLGVLISRVPCSLTLRVENFLS